MSDYSDYLDSNTCSYESLIKNKELTDLIRWADDKFESGGPLKVILCGDYNDSVISSYDNDRSVFNKLSEEDIPKVNRIIDLLIPLTEEEREMACQGEVMTGSLFNLLYNGIPDVVNVLKHSARIGKDSDKPTCVLIQEDVVGVLLRRLNH